MSRLVVFPSPDMPYYSCSAARGRATEGGSRGSCESRMDTESVVGNVSAMVFVVALTTLTRNLLQLISHHVALLRARNTTCALAVSVVSRRRRQMRLHGRRRRFVVFVLHQHLLVPRERPFAAG